MWFFKYLSLVIIISLGLQPIFLSADTTESKTSSTKVSKKPSSKKKSTKKRRKKRVRIDTKKLEAKQQKIRTKKIAFLEKKIKTKPTQKLKEQLGGLYLEDSQPAKAIEIFRELLDPNDLKSYLNLAAAYRAQNTPLDEIRVLNQVIPKWPNYANLYYLQANAFKKIDKLDDATIKYRKTLSLQPKFEDAYWGLYEIFKVKKNNYEGRIILQDMIRIFGEKPKYYTELCRNYTDDSYFEESLNACQIAVRLDAKTAENHVYLGLTHQYKDNKVQAEKILSYAARQFPRSAFAQVAAGTVMQEKENYEVASKYFQACTKIDSKEIKCWKGVAQTNFQLGRYKTALQAYKTVCKEDRSILTEFKKQAAILRINGKSDWYDQYTEAVTACYY